MQNLLINIQNISNPSSKNIPFIWFAQNEHLLSKQPFEDLN